MCHAAYRNPFTDRAELFIRLYRRNGSQTVTADVSAEPAAPDTTYGEKQVEHVHVLRLYGEAGDRNICWRTTQNPLRMEGALVWRCRVLSPGPKAYMANVYKRIPSITPVYETDNAIHGRDDLSCSGIRRSTAS